MVRYGRREPEDLWIGHERRQASEDGENAQNFNCLPSTLRCDEAVAVTHTEHSDTTVR